MGFKKLCAKWLPSFSRMVIFQQYLKRLRKDKEGFMYRFSAMGVTWSQNHDPEKRNTN